MVNSDDLMKMNHLQSIVPLVSVLFCEYVLVRYKLEAFIYVINKIFTKSGSVECRLLLGILQNCNKIVV